VTAILASDVRPRWVKWVVPRRGDELRVVVSVCWYLLSLVVYCVNLIEYGLTSRPIDHGWLAVSNLAFMGWLFLCGQLHRRR